MTTTGGSNNVPLHGSFFVWFDPKQPTNVHLTANSRDLVHPETGSPGLHLVFSSKPKSANFDPKTFNTLRALLQRNGKPHPDGTADESIPRRLDRRFGPSGSTSHEAPERPAEAADDEQDDQHRHMGQGWDTAPGEGGQHGTPPV
jgi:hypothetical protein